MPIQAAAIPKALAGHDLLAAAQTGTGKTAAFMLPGSLERLKRYATPSTSPAMHPVRMLVLTPTRELADQIDQNVKPRSKTCRGATPCCLAGWTWTRKPAPCAPAAKSWWPPSAACSIM